MPGRAAFSTPRTLGRIVFTLMVVAAYPPLTAGAQTVSGTILGTVTDASGSVIPHAKVTVVNEGTGLTRTVQTDSANTPWRPSPPGVTR